MLFQKKKTDGDAPPPDAPLPVETTTVEVPAVVTQTDQGIPYGDLGDRHIVNLSEGEPGTGGYLNKRIRQLHVNGRPFTHVSEDADGHWIYRHEHDD